MNVVIGTEAVQFLLWEYINAIFLCSAVRPKAHRVVAYASHRDSPVCLNYLTKSSPQRVAE
jgi:hypothetical protein